MRQPARWPGFCGSCEGAQAYAKPPVIRSARVLPSSCIQATFFVARLDFRFVRVEMSLAEPCRKVVSLADRFETCLRFGFGFVTRGGWQLQDGSLRALLDIGEKHELAGAELQCVVMRG